MQENETKVSNLEPEKQQNTNAKEEKLKKKENVEKGKKIAEKRRVRRKAKRLAEANTRMKMLRKLLVIMLVFLLVIYFVLKIVYETGRFTIVLDSASDMKGALIMYANKDEKISRRTLQADVLDFMTNISGDWIPENINDEADGGHNGDNYIAYTFYVENVSDETIHYWYRIYIDDVIKNVDEAMRVAIYLNGNKTVYAKKNRSTGKPEKNTVAFKDEENVMLEQRKNFKPGDVDKFTIVIWIEGDDPQCIDDLIGGEMKMHMTITEEHIVNTNYGFKVDLDDKSALIDKDTGKTKNDTSTLDFTIGYSGNFENTKICVSLYRRKYDEIYSYGYEMVDLADYVSTELTSTSTEKEYLVTDLVQASQNYTLTLKQGLKTGTYKIRFSLYDNDTLITSVDKPIIIK